MAVQTERITILGTPDFKAFLNREAKKENISLSELVRRRCQKDPDEDETLLSALVDEVKQATRKAKSSLEKGLTDVENVLTELRGAGI